MSEILRTWSVDGLVRHIQQVNIIPFKTILNGLFNNPLPVEIKTLVYNIVAFFPLGFLLPYIRENLSKWQRVLLIGLFISFALEFVQLVTLLGEADIDDMLLNGTGVMLGYGFFVLTVAMYRKIWLFRNLCRIIE